MLAFKEHISFQLEKGVWNDSGTEKIRSLYLIWNYGDIPGIYPASFRVLHMSALGNWEGCTPVAFNTPFDTYIDSHP